MNWKEFADALDAFKGTNFNTWLHINPAYGPQFKFLRVHSLHYVRVYVRARAEGQDNATAHGEAKAATVTKQQKPSVVRTLAQAPTAPKPTAIVRKVKR